MVRSLSDLHEEALVGKTRNGDQKDDCARSPEGSPGGCHATASRGHPAPAEGRGAARDGDDAAPEHEWLEAAHGSCAINSAGVRGRREGRTPLASADRELATAPWCQPDGPGAVGGRERTSRCSLGSRRIDSDRAEPDESCGVTEGEEAGGEGVARAQGQGDGIAEAPDSQASREETAQKIEAIGGGL